MREGKVKKENHLNETAVLWKSEGISDAEREALRNEVFLLAFELYDDTSESFLDSLLEACEKYDDERGSFSHYLKFLLSRRSKDAYEKQQKHAPNADSLDAPISDDNTLTLGEVVADPKASDPGQIDWLDGMVADLTAQILNFAERHTQNAANEIRRSWYRMFYTEDMTLASKAGHTTLLHERDVFTAMDVDYLDYYMSSSCRRLQKLSMTSLKPYNKVVPTRPSTDETPLPIPRDVSITYVETHGKLKASSQGNMHSAYRAEVKRLKS